MINTVLIPERLISHYYLFKQTVRLKKKPSAHGHYFVSMQHWPLYVKTNVRFIVSGDTGFL
jgi:hypothetical protein